MRPAVAVVLPFFGGTAEADDALAQLAGLDLRSGDERLLVDNTDDGAALGRPLTAQVRVVESEVKASAYAARNIGVEVTSAPWILFVDADCRLSEHLLDAYFELPPAGDCGAVAGQVLGLAAQGGTVPSYIRSRGHLDQDLLRHHPYRPMAVTANLLVRRDAWEAVGGFAESPLSGADADFCWRMGEAGWALEYRERAFVSHVHRETLGSLFRQARRDGSAGPWLARRYPDYPARLGLRMFVRAVVGAIAWPLLARPRRGLFKAIDGLWGIAFNLGSILDDASPGPRMEAPRAVVMLEEFPAAGDPIVAALGEVHDAGGDLLVETLRRPPRAGWQQGRRVPVRHWEDQNVLTRARSVARVFVRKRRLAPGALAPAVRRLMGADRGALVLAEPAVASTAELVLELAVRPDLRIEILPSDRDAAARRLRQLAERG